MKRKKRKSVRKSMSSSRASSSIGFYIIIFILLSVTAFLGFRYMRIYQSNQLSDNAPLPTATPTPTPIVLPTGKGVFSVSQGKHDGPTFITVSFDPIDVRSGQSTTITVELTNPMPVTEVTGILESDNHTRNPFTMKQISTKGNISTWEATLDITDTLWYTYTVELNAKAANGVTKNTVMPR